MKFFPSLGIVGFVCAVSSCATKQSFSTQDAHYAVTWSGDRVKSIVCRSDKLPEGGLSVDISWGSDQEQVLINREGHQVWSKNVFTRRAEVAAESGGIVFYGESTPDKANRLEIREWTLWTNSIPIYKEVEIKDENGEIKRQEFFGPFGIVLRPPNSRKH